MNLLVITQPSRKSFPESVSEAAAVILPAHPHAAQLPPEVSLPAVDVRPPAAGGTARQEEPRVVHRHEAAGVGGGHLGVGVGGQLLETPPVSRDLQAGIINGLN